LVWILEINLLEGRINLLQKPDPIGRFVYAITANIMDLFYSTTVDFLR
jgi:hypothetical protein